MGTPASTHPVRIDPAADARVRPAGSWLDAGALAAAGVLFIAYPALRPYAEETTLAGAAAMASGAWVAAHTFGMAAFAMLAIGLQRLLHPRLHDPRLGDPRRRAPRLRDPRTVRRWASQRPRPSRQAWTMAWLGALLVLPYYGAETFGLRAIGARALAEGDAELLVDMVEALRYDPTAITMFAIGLIALAVSGVALSLALSQGSPGQRLGGLLAGAGLALYLPQFFGSPALRLAHGVVLGMGCVILAVTAVRSPQPTSTHAPTAVTHDPTTVTPDPT